MGTSSAHEGSFGFGLNDIDFSDRVLRLEITPLALGNVSECDTTGFKVITLHVTSLILAAKSPFFYKLFKNGMRESQRREDVTLRINASEETAFMDLLNFMYGNPLRATSAADLVDVLMLADKFDVSSCTKYCIDSLFKLPMSIDSAIFYLELPSHVLEAEVVKPLIKAAKQYLAAHFKDFAKSQGEAMSLPLPAIEVVLGSDGLQVDSEDVVRAFIWEWARVHYPKLDECLQIISTRLMCFICNSSISRPDFEFPRRVYKYHQIKVVNFESPWRRCIVYLDLKKEECADLFPSKALYSQAFYLGGREFLLIALCRQKQNLAHHFGLFLEMKGSESCKLDIKLAVMEKSSKEFQSEITGRKSTFTSTEKAKGLLLFEWTDLMSDESAYFIDGILHLRAQITLHS